MPASPLGSMRDSAEKAAAEIQTIFDNRNSNSLDTVKEVTQSVHAFVKKSETTADQIVGFPVQKFHSLQNLVELTVRYEIYQENAKKLQEELKQTSRMGSNDAERLDKRKKVLQALKDLFDGYRELEKLDSKMNTTNATTGDVPNVDLNLPELRDSGSLLVTNLWDACGDLVKTSEEDESVYVFSQDYRVVFKKFGILVSTRKRPGSVEKLGTVNSLGSGNQQQSRKGNTELKPSITVNPTTPQPVSQSVTSSENVSVSDAFMQLQVVSSSEHLKGPGTVPGTGVAEPAIRSSDEKLPYNPDAPLKNYPPNSGSLPNSNSPVKGAQHMTSPSKHEGGGPSPPKVSHLDNLDETAQFGPYVPPQAPQIGTSIVPGSQQMGSMPGSQGMNGQAPPSGSLNGKAPPFSARVPFTGRSNHPVGSIDEMEFTFDPMRPATSPNTKDIMQKQREMEEKQRVLEQYTQGVGMQGNNQNVMQQMRHDMHQMQQGELQHHNQAHRQQYQQQQVKTDKAMEVALINDLWRYMHLGDIEGYKRVRDGLRQMMIRVCDLRDAADHSALWDALAFQHSKLAVLLLEDFPTDHTTAKTDHTGPPTAPTWDFSEMHQRRRDTLLHAVCGVRPFNKDCVKLFTYIFDRTPRHLLDHSNSAGLTVAETAARKNNFWVLLYMINEHLSKTGISYRESLGKIITGNIDLTVQSLYPEEVMPSPPTSTKFPDYFRAGDLLSVDANEPYPSFSDVCFDVNAVSKNDLKKSGKVHVQRSRFYGHVAILSSHSKKLKRIFKEAPVVNGMRNIRVEGVITKPVWKCLIQWCYTGVVFTEHLNPCASLSVEFFFACVHYEMPKELVRYAQDRVSYLLKCKVCPMLLRRMMDIFSADILDIVVRVPTQGNNTTAQTPTIGGSTASSTQTRTQTRPRNSLRDTYGNHDIAMATASMVLLHGHKLTDLETHHFVTAIQTAEKRLASSYNNMMKG